MHHSKSRVSIFVSVTKFLSCTESDFLWIQLNLNVARTVYFGRSFTLSAQNVSKKLLSSLTLLDVILLHASQLNKYVFTALIVVTFYLITLIVSSFNLVFFLHCDLKACTSVPRGRSLTVSSVEKSNK